MRRATRNCVPRWRRLPRERPQASARPLYAWYGDDFTGSTDVLEALALHGVKAVLFTRTPSARAICTRFLDCRAVGIAGESRSRSPDWMSRNLPAIFRAMQPARCAGQSLQSLLHLRQLAARRQHWPRNGDWVARSSGRHLCPLWWERRTSAALWSLETCSPTPVASSIASTAIQPCAVIRSRR